MTTATLLPMRLIFLVVLLLCVVDCCLLLAIFIIIIEIWCCYLARLPVCLPVVSVIIIISSFVAGEICVWRCACVCV